MEAKFISATLLRVGQFPEQKVSLVIFSMKIKS